MPLAYLALGANLPSSAGPPQATLAAAAGRLESLGRVTARSSLYSTAPVGDADQPRFVNAVIAFETRLAPRDLLHSLLALEREFGRDRSACVPNGPRALDLDILFYGRQILTGPGLEIPHPRLAERPFVLIPLHEIAPRHRDPRSGRTIAELLAALNFNPGQLPASVARIESPLWSVLKS
jgi:2-amino-4-hydroxy-6-hydroxymethyldihydropteridine diphosphokinase